MKQKIINIFCLCIIMTIAFSCNKIQTEKDLKKSDIELIKSLGLLDEDEKIRKFYSQHKNNVGGNFFTNKRVATYWLDEHHESRRTINTAYYSDIINLDTVFLVGLTNSPYIKVIKSDSTKFNLYIGGKPDELKSFYEDILSLWKRNKKQSE